MEWNYDPVPGLLGHSKCAIGMSNTCGTFSERSFQWHRLKLKNTYVEVQFCNSSKETKGEKSTGKILKPLPFPQEYRLSKEMDSVLWILNTCIKYFNFSKLLFFPHPKIPEQDVEFTKEKKKTEHFKQLKFPLRS